MVRPLSFAVSQAELLECPRRDDYTRGDSIRVLTSYFVAVLIAHAMRPVKTIIELDEELNSQRRALTQ